MLENAIEYGNFGFNVFPIKGKIPALKNWQDEATFNPEKLQKLFNIPHTGIGLVTGKKNRVTVIDIDVKDGKNGFKTLEVLGIQFEETVCFETGTGGRQYIFEYCPEVVNGVDVFGKKSGIDIRNDGGLSVLPPSIHPDTGKPYKWMPDQSLSEVKVASFPKDFLEVYKAREIGVNGKRTKFVLPKVIAKGQRNDTLFRYACQLRASGTDKDKILSTVDEINKERCEEPLDKDEVGRIVEGACEYDKGSIYISEKGKIKKTLLNIVNLFNADPNLIGLFYYNLFVCNILYTRIPFWSEDIKPEKNLDDTDLILVKHYLSSYHRVEVHVMLIQEAITVVAYQNKKHPVREYLNSLKWDGTSRLNNWLTIAAGVTENQYSSCIGMKTLVAAVARVYQPGIKFDYMLILEGTQGIGKSTAVKILAGDWYAPVSLTDTDKDTVDIMLGAWIIENEEMVCFSRQEIEKVKAFISRPIDKVRLSYGRRSQEFPRQSIFIGTMNPVGDSDYLRDQSGNRRFWPVRCERSVDFKWLKENRDQLFAEAVVRLKAGEGLWIDDPKINAMAQFEQEIRQSKDPWTYHIAHFVSDPQIKEIRLPQILESCLSIPVAKVTKSEQTRIGIIMSQLGWVRIFDKEKKCSVYYRSEEFIHPEKEEKPNAETPITP